MQRRIQDVVEYARTARERLPDMEIGIIDALPSKGLDYQGSCGELAAAVGDDLRLDLSTSTARTSVPRRVKIFRGRG